MRARRRSSGCGAMGFRLVAPGRPNRPEAADPFTWASPPSVRNVWARPVGRPRAMPIVLTPTVTRCSLSQAGQMSELGDAV